MKQRTFVLCALLLLGAPGRSWADEPIDWKSFIGLPGVQVSASVRSASEKFDNMVDPATFKTRVQLRLRQSGVRVLTSEDAPDSALRFPQLRLTVMAVPGDPEEHAYAVYCELAVTQYLWTSDSGSTVNAYLSQTWSRGQVMSYGRTVIQRGDLSSDVDELIDEFLNAWLQAHPK